MIAKIIGRRNVNFNDAKGVPVAYDELHCSMRDENIEGTKTFKVNTKLTLGQVMTLDREYVFDYEPTSAGKAKLVSLSLVPFAGPAMPSAK